MACAFGARHGLARAGASLVWRNHPWKMTHLSQSASRTLLNESGQAGRWIHWSASRSQNQTPIVMNSHPRSLPLTPDRVVSFLTVLASLGLGLVLTASRVSSQTIADAPELLAPDDMVAGQPRNLAFYWTLVDGATGYIWEASSTSNFTSPISLSSDADSLSFADNALDLAGSFYWRVRGINESAVGPWSEVWSATLSEDTLMAGDSGPLTIDESFMFVEVAGPDDRYACGANAGSAFGCPEVGGNLVYSSFNGSGEYVMYREGAGTEDVIGPFGPNDFEIRFTDAGSFAYLAFETGKAIHVPFEMWDIGPTYTGTSVNPNDPADDVRMIPVLFAGARTECEWFYDPIGGDPFGVFDGSTQRVYAYYPTTSYQEWDALVRPLVEAHPDGCPLARDLTGGAVEDEIDFERGRPIQRTIFIGDSASDPPHPPTGVVVRFYTREPIRPSAPIPSSPIAGAEIEQPASLWWNGTPGRTEYQLEITSSQGVEIDTVLLSTHFELTSLDGGTEYDWRLRASNVHGTSEWSPTWTFSVASIVSVDTPGLPQHPILLQNYPNPVAGTATITLELPRAMVVRLTLYDVLGRDVQTIASGNLSAGAHRISVDTSDLSAGVYFYRLDSHADALTRKMLVLQVD